MTTRPLTIAAEIDPDRRPALDRALATIAGDLEDNDVLVPGHLPDTHFTRWVIVADRRDELPALLVWESNHDGATTGYLEAVADAAPDGLDALFGCCRDYPTGGARDRTAFLRWMGERSLRAEAFYTGYRGVPRRQVLNDRAVHDAIRMFLDRERHALGAMSRLDIHRRIRDHVDGYTHLDTSRQGDGAWRLGLKKAAVGLCVALAVLVAIALLPLTLLAGSLIVRTLRREERTDRPDTTTRPVHADSELLRLEDLMVQNQLTHLVDIKPGRFRLLVLRGVLRTIDLLARVHFVHGHLGGITSIHFARWVILYDRRRGVARRRHRLLFFSNYDGSWESYLGEFIDRAASGLTAIWSNTEGFPRTRDLTGEGARDEEAFKQWTRNHQIPTQIWWSGVPDSTVDNIRDDVWIRRRLDRRLTDPELYEWLRRL